MPATRRPTAILAADVASYSRLMGVLDEARKIITQLRAISPVVVPRTPLGNAEHRELILSSLRLAAGEAE